MTEDAKSRCDLCGESDPPIRRSLPPVWVNWLQENTPCDRHIVGLCRNCEDRVVCIEDAVDGPAPNPEGDKIRNRKAREILEDIHQRYAEDLATEFQIALTESE